MSVFKLKTRNDANEKNQNNAPLVDELEQEANDQLNADIAENVLKILVQNGIREKAVALVTFARVINPHWIERIQNNGLMRVVILAAPPVPDVHCHL